MLNLEKKIIPAVSGSDFFKKITEKLSGDRRVSAGMMHGSLKSFFAQSLREHYKKPLIVVCESTAAAQDYYHDLSLNGSAGRASLLTPPPKNFKSVTEGSHSHIGWLIEGLTNIIKYDDMLTITTPEIFDIEIPAPELIADNRITLKKGGSVDFDGFVKNLALNGFDRKDYVSGQGDIAVRGGIVDIYPVSWDNPLRIEFWGDEIESIREFNTLSQRSVQEHDEVEFTASLFQNIENEKISALFEYISDDTIFIVDSPEQTDPEKKIIPKFDKYRLIELNSFHNDVKLRSAPQPDFGGSVRKLTDELRKLKAFGHELILTADSRIHLERMQDLVENAITEGGALETIEGISPAEPEDTYKALNWAESSPSGGFILRDAGISVFTEHEIFQRRRASRPASKQDKGITIKELRALRLGDYVVHEDKGIGQFDGFETVKIGGSNQDCVRILFAGGDLLYVSMNYINKIQKYQAQEGAVPKLTKLGSAEWVRKKARAKKRLKDIARELIQLYAKRKMEPGFAFPADNVWQKEFEASFIYEDTPDQAKSTDEVKKDMESATPMDRLVCGDVGFGKTEVAIRAIFKAVQAGKQAAVLVPTTILAQQHYMTFLDRLHKYPVMVDVISRFRTTAQQKQILEKLKSGGIDILIGTHRLLSKDIHFKDLGLLIIDEEHRFGVSAKEKLRELRATVDTLTLTATPIPRTLNFSLMGARDLSIIETPPRNRLPVYTEIIEWNNDKLSDFIQREISRGGQVFFVNDKIEDLEKISMDLKMLMPDVTFGIAHGQMKPTQIESVMQKFIQRKYDVLVTTKIVESGLDIPNANTMIINRANNFGLAELYQLRGRVGRSNQQAYCYLVIPPVAKLSTKSMQRLQAIEEFTDLGSGFQLAMRDMEIRGAGNLLGAEQSGYIIDIGFEMFQKVLDEAVEELHREEFSSIFKEVKKEPIFENEDVSIELNTDALLPESYIQNETDRFMFYRRLYKVRNNSELEEVTSEIIDRFGKMPEQAKELVFAVKTRIAALDTGFTRVIIKPHLFVAEFPPDSKESFYKKAFPYLVDFINSMDHTRLNQTKTKLYLEVKIPNRDKAVEILWKIKQTLKNFEYEEEELENA